jgi:uncharacterized protein HemX
MMMGKASIALLALAAALAAGGAGYWRGHVAGKAAAQARQDAALVRQLGQELDSHRDLIDSANAASAHLRADMAAQRTRERQYSKEFRDVLNESAVNRANCRFGAGVVQRLDAARERAAQAAAGGGAATVPGAGSGAGR